MGRTNTFADRLVIIYSYICKQRTSIIWWKEYYYEAKTDFILHTVTRCSAELPTRMRTVPKGTEETQETKEGVALRCSSPRASYGVRQLYRV